MMYLRHIFLFLILLCTAPTFALVVSVTVTSDAICGNPLGSLVAYANGGVPPYTFAWSNGAIEASNMGLSAGTYSVNVTDAVGTVVSGEGTVQSLDSYPTSTTLVGGYCNDIQPTVYFFAGVMYGLPPDPASGTRHGPGPYSFTSPNYPVAYGEVQDCEGVVSYYEITAVAPPGAPVVVNYADGSGCPGSFTFLVPQPLQFPSMQVTNISGSCSNASIGSATLSVGVLGGQPNIRYRLKQSGQVVQLGDCGWVLYDSPTTYTYSNLAAGTYWVVADVDIYAVHSDISVVACSDSISFTIPDLGTTCGLVSGRIYVDNNANCVVNTGENNVPNTIIEITPGPYYTTTNLNGSYSVTLPYGTYQFAEQSLAVQQSCPLSVTLASPSLTNRHIGVAGGMPLDARVLIANGPARPGFELLYVIDVENLTTATTGAVTLTVNADPALIPVSTQPTASASGNTFTWSLSMAGAFQRRVVYLRMRVPPDVGLMGNTLTTTASVTTANTDVDLANNTAISQQIVTGSYDPNDKLVRTTANEEGVFLVGVDDWLDYTIRFQNTGTDTAFNVVITDTLPATLDPATVIWGPTSHTCTKAITNNGILKFMHTNILLPDSNVNEPRSHGFVNFRIRARQPVVQGTQIINIANIYFDYNPPVITDPSVLTVTPPGVALSAKVMLGGPYVEATARMSDGLRSLGLLPLVEPYTAMGHHLGTSGGGERTDLAVLAVTGDDAIVDWVLVELRSAAAPHAIVASHSALLQRDGDVVPTRGSGPLYFNAPAGNYRVAIRHRHHLGCMTSTAVALSPSPTVVDLSSATTNTYGTNARKSVGSRRVLWPGNGFRDDRLKYTGVNNDRDPILQRIGGMVPTNTVNGYLLEDVNMDGTVKYTGTNNDRDLILEGIGSVPTHVQIEQLP